MFFYKVFSASSASLCENIYFSVYLCRRQPDNVFMAGVKKKEIDSILTQSHRAMESGKIKKFFGRRLSTLQWERLRKDI